MNTIGWSILAVGLLFNIDMQKIFYGKEISNGAAGVGVVMILFCLGMMIYSTLSDLGVHK